MPLEDNLPTDNYHYQLTVYTGVRTNAGTDSHVRFIMSGDEGDTGVRRLYDGKRKVCVWNQYNEDSKSKGKQSFKAHVFMHAHDYKYPQCKN